MKNLQCIIILISAAFTTRAVAQEASIFPKGEKAPNVNHVGNVWLHELTEPDSVFNYGVSVATFDPGARLNWHQHPGGQILLITAGTGYYQEKGKPKQTVRKGDVVKCAPGVAHWHGATPESGVTYLSTTPAQNGKTVWLEKLTEQEYLGGK
jgi:quercetin dioxygenase-like cupin family protein